MKNWKKKSSELGQWVQKNRLVKWFHDKDISTQYRILFVIFASVIIILNIINIHFNSFEINDTSAQYLLSALVQSLAAIIAIVVTLTLVAVQLTASAYSPRVIDIFKENKIMWWLLVWYGLSIFSGLFVLGMIGGTHSNSWCIIVPLEILVLPVYLMGIAAFAGLFWHIGNMIDLLKPENIIKRLADKITKDRILNLKEDPIQPIMDIIHGSVMKYDLVTTRIGLEAVTDRVIEIIDSDSQKDISKCFCDRLGRVGGLTASKMDTDSSIEVVKNLYNFWKSTATKKFDFAASQAALSLELFGKAAIDQKFEFAARYTMGHLELIGRDAVEKEDVTTTWQAVECLGPLGMGAADKGLRATQQAIESLEIVGTCAIRKGTEFKDVVNRAVKCLGFVGIAAARSGLEDVTRKAAESLGRLGITVAAKGNEFEEVTKQVMHCLKAIVLYSGRPGLETVAWAVARSFIGWGTCY